MTLTKYVPGCRTVPGISVGSLTTSLDLRWTLLSAPRALDGRAAKIKPNRNNVERLLRYLIV